MRKKAHESPADALSLRSGRNGNKDQVKVMFFDAFFVNLRDPPADLHKAAERTRRKREHFQRPASDPGAHSRVLFRVDPQNHSVLPGRIEVNLSFSRIDLEHDSVDLTHVLLCLLACYVFDHRVGGERFGQNFYCSWVFSWGNLYRFYNALTLSYLPLCTAKGWIVNK